MRVCETNARGRREELALLLAHGLLSASLAASVAFLPLYLSHVGVEGVAALTGWSAAAFGGGVAVSTFATPLWGALGDRVGRRAMAIRAALGLALVQGLFLLAETPEQVVGIRLLQGAISGVHPALFAWAATTATRERLGRTLGRMESVGAGASMLAPLAAAGLVAAGGFPLVYTAAAAIAALAVPLLLLTKASPGADAEAAEGPRLGLLARLRQVWGLPGVRGLLFTACLIELAQSTAELLYPILVVQLTPDPALQALAIGLIEVVGEGAYLVAAPFLGRAVDRHGAGPVLRGSAIASGLATLAAPLATTPWMLLPLAAVGDGASAGIHPGLYGRLAQVVPAGSVGTAISLAGSAVRAGGAVGVALAAPLVAVAGLTGGFVCAGAWLLMAAWRSPGARAPADAALGLGKESV